jgi:hypothetical protein
MIPLIPVQFFDNRETRMTLPRLQLVTHKLQARFPRFCYVPASCTPSAILSPCANARWRVPPYSDTTMCDATTTVASNAMCFTGKRDTPLPHIYACSTPSLLGISFKTQALYVTVFVARYLDLFNTWVSFYNFVMKLFISSSIYILYLMKVRFRYVTIQLLYLRFAQPCCVAQNASVRQTTRPSTPSASSSSSAPHYSSGSYSTTPTPSQRSSGLSPSSSRPLPSSRNSSSSSAQAKQKPSRRTTSPRWVHTVDCTSLTGYTGASFSMRCLVRVDAWCSKQLTCPCGGNVDISRSNLSTQSRSRPVSYRRGYISIFFMYISPSTCLVPSHAPFPVLTPELYYLHSHPYTGFFRARSSSCQHDI